MKNDSLFIKEYNKANNLNVKHELDIYDECYFSYLDILSEKEVEINSKVYSDCKCVSSVNFSAYYDKCDKCKGTGKLLLNGNKAICNHCKGKKMIIKEICPLCLGEGKVVKRGKIKVKLSRDLKEGDIITVKNKGKESNGLNGDLFITVKIKDLECFEIKNNDVYDRRMVDFSKEEISKGVSKRIETIKGYVNVKSNGEVKEEVVRLEGKGIDNGDYYICLSNELIPLKGEDVYKNVIINKDMLGFYLNKSEFDSDNKCLNVCYYKKLNSKDYEYIELSDVNNFKVVKLKGKGKPGKNGGVSGDLYLRIYFENEFFNINDELYYKPIKLSKYEIMDGKKVLEFEKEKVNLSFEKNMDGERVIFIKDLGFMSGKNTMDGCYFTVCSKDIYKVNVNVSKRDKVIYLKDYKKYFYEDVKFNYNEGLKVVLSKKSEVVVDDKDGSEIRVRVTRIGG